MQRDRDIKLHGVFNVVRNSIPGWNTRAQDAWGSGEKWGQKGRYQTVNYITWRTLAFTQQTVPTALSWGKAGYKEEGLEIWVTEGWETAEAATAQAQEDEGLNPDRPARTRWKGWQSPISYVLSPAMNPQLPEPWVQITITGSPGILYLKKILDLWSSILEI